MRGVGGKTGWFWLFLLEGILTFVIGFAVCSSKIFRSKPYLNYYLFHRVISIFPTPQRVLRGFCGASPGTMNGKRSS